VVATDMSGFTKTDAGHDLTVGMQALKRLAQPDDISGAIAFLASPAAWWISGDTLRGDSGSKLQNRKEGTTTRYPLSCPHGDRYDRTDALTHRVVHLNVAVDLGQHGVIVCLSTGCSMSHALVVRIGTCMSAIAPSMSGSGGGLNRVSGMLCSKPR